MEMKRTAAGREYYEFPHGSQVISTGVEYFSTSPDKVMQKPGDIMLVNHDRWESGPAGTSTRGEHAGLCNLMNRRICRLATMEDDGYLATKEEWAKYYGFSDRPKAQLFFWRFVAVFSFTLLTLVCLS